MLFHARNWISVHPTITVEQKDLSENMSEYEIMRAACKSLTSNLSMNSLTAAASPVRYFGFDIFRDL